MIYNIDYHVTDRCNLKCVGCNNYCPLVPDDFKDKTIDEVREDFNIISKFRGDFVRLSIIGGEPSLNKNIPEILDLAREMFPDNEIVMVSNGLLVRRLIGWKDSFIKNDVHLIVTIYPYTPDDTYITNYNTIINEFPNNLLTMWDYRSEDGILFFQTKMLSNDIINSEEETKQCSMRYCTQYKDGFIYLCGYHANLKYLKAKFPDIKIEDDLSLDLRTATSEDLTNFVNNAVPNICLHCRAANKICLLVPWKQSTKTLDEWVDTEFSA